MTFSQLKTFLEVARQGSVRGAAASLLITEPSVSAALAALRDELQVALVARDGRGIRLTPAGSELARYAEIIHLRPNAGFLKHSMDFTLTEQYLEAGYRHVWETLGGNRRGRRVAGVSPAAVAAPAPAPA